MSSRHLMLLIVIVMLSSLLLNSQETRYPPKPKLPQCAKDVVVSPPKCGDEGQLRRVVISCKIEDGKVKPHAIPNVLHMCAKDSVVWTLDPHLELVQHDFLILFDQEKSPFRKQFFTREDKISRRPTVKKIDPEHKYHYKVWFQDGESEDPHIIIH